MILFRKKEIIAITRQKYEDLEFQLLELETRCESELEQAEEHFQNEQNLLTQNAKLRQVQKKLIINEKRNMCLFIFYLRMLYVNLIINNI